MKRFAFAVLTLCPLVTLAQNDTTFVADARKNAIQYYTQTMGVQSHIFNGSEYREYISQRDEFPTLYDDIVNGNVKYAGELYENIPLTYDLQKDQVITSYTHGNKVQLLRDKVEYFDIGGHRFVRLNNNKVAEGFYDLLYDGKMKFYAKRLKVLALRINGNDADNIFEERVKYYILKNDVYHTVKSKRSVLSLVSDKKRDIKRTIREEKLKFGKTREQSIARILERYEQIQ
ncbi:MAG TPA: hypothetical protein VFE50_17030 [Cyclobacteriaceae bacterium]|nr:hypothetical protein [Cyclobacteriaceae bacterium]